LLTSFVTPLVIIMHLASALNVLIKLVLLRGRLIIRESGTLKNINMKPFDFDFISATAIAILLILSMHLFSKIKNLQTQIDELKIVVDQKFLPAMIFNKDDFQIR